MARRRRRRLEGSTPGMGFFAFQDIITAVIGIIVVITIYLALTMKSLVPTVTPSPVDPELQRHLDDLIAQVAAAKATLLSLATPSEIDTAQLQSKIALLESSRETLTERVKIPDSSIQNQAAAESQFQQELSREAATVKAAVDQAQTTNESLETKLAQAREKMLELEKSAQQAEANLVALQNASAFRLIPDQSQTTKEPILVVASRNGLNVEEFDGGARTEIPGGQSAISDLADLLDQYSALDQYIVFYFKPSILPEMESFIAVARKAGFDVGYDAIPEDVDLSFQRPTPATQ